MVKMIFLRQELCERRGSEATEYGSWHLVRFFSVGRLRLETVATERHVLESTLHNHVATQRSSLLPVSGEMDSRARDW